MPRSIDLDRLTDDQLLDLRLCELPLRIKGTPLEGRVARLQEELKVRGLRFKPHVWLSEEWFTPDGVPGFAIPFYLAHPRLAKLERSRMLEVEGGSESECMRIMRHEAGHAADNAYGLHSEHRYRSHFGSFTRRYPNSYRPKPNSRNYVLHLPAWYAQAHPAEDFAETFAVWLAPGSSWRRRYAGWPALRKLEYVDEIMRGLARKAPACTSRARVAELGQIETTLREHYRNKRKHYVLYRPSGYDSDLLRIFSTMARHASAPSAVGFLQRNRRELSREVAEGTGAHAYAVDQILATMISRSRELKLRIGLTPEHTRRRLLVLLTAQTMNGIHSGYHRVPL